MVNIENELQLLITKRDNIYNAVKNMSLKLETINTNIKALTTLKENGYK